MSKVIVVRFRGQRQELRNRYDEPACAAAQRVLEGRLLAWFTQANDMTPFDMDPWGSPAH